MLFSLTIIRETGIPKIRLADYLKEASAEGEMTGEGSFTLARRKALDKLAAHTLPFESDWILKVIQAAVASGVRSSIKVKIERHETVISFAAESCWGMESIERAFYQPEATEERSLDHLKVALWAAGIEGRRAFRILMPGDTDMLIWNGNRLQRLPRDRRVPRFELAVTPLGVGAVKAFWLGRYMLTNERNADILRTLCQNCFMCPAPLIVDGRHIGGLEKLYLPAGTPVQVCVQELNSHPLTKGSPPTLVVSGVVNKDQFNTAPGESTLRWILDGVTISTENLTRIPTSLCATLFLDAQGMATDLTGLQLQDNEEKRERVKHALTEAKASLSFMMGSLQADQVETPHGFLDFLGFTARVEYWRARLPAEFDEFVRAFQEIEILSE